MEVNVITKDKTIRFGIAWLVAGVLLLALPTLTSVALIDINHDTSACIDEQLAEDSTRLRLTIRGEFDFLLKEDIHLTLAAILTDTDNGNPISGASVTFTVYDPDRNPLMLGPLVEEIPDSGVYVNTSQLTMKEMDLPKGIYLVYAHAVTLDGYRAVDMIQFHIDPPGESSLESIPLVGIGGIMFTVGIAGIWVRRREQLSRFNSNVNIRF